MPRIPVSDITDKRLAPFSGMTDGQLKRGEGFRRDNPTGLFIGESAKVIERALEAGVVPLSVLACDHWLEHDSAVVSRIENEYEDVPIFCATKEQFSEITGYEVVRGVLACFERPTPLTCADVLEGAKRIAILEDVNNYTNMGAIFRSAAALGIDGILLSPGCHDPYYRRCARVSMGAVFQIPWARIDDAKDAQDWAVDVLPQLHEIGFSTLAFALRDDALDLHDFYPRADERLALIFGAEGDGLRPKTIERADQCVTIPMAHKVDSLNVAACAAIAFWQLAS